MNTPTADPVVQTFLRELRRGLGTSFVELRLFGSRARGDAQEGSDYDMLVIANGELAVLKIVVREAEWACMETHNALVSSVVYTPEVWERRKDSPLGWNILREGRLVA
jgi:predicted nucleotidyltransferase